MSKHPHRSLLIPLVALATACAAEQPPVNRVQPNALDKAFFVGADLVSPHDDPEFWAQGTLVDVGFGAQQDGLFTSTYAQPMTRVKWVVQENLLVARLTYERIEGSDGKGVGPASTDGQVVAAYRILSHFDIQRDYNPMTGEETNVVGENSWDRPWNERQYMRVDWSSNLNVDAYELDTLSQLGVYGGITYEPLAYWINDPNHPDAPHFDTAGGYFDVTVKAFARPGIVDLRRFGIDAQYPACFFGADFAGGTAPSGNCNPVELTIRQSFRKVVDNDYEPAEWDGDRFKAFGAFYSERSGYTREYGMTDAQWHRLINRYNIWKKSHTDVACFTPATTPAGADPHRDANGDGTEDECNAVGGGSRCDTFRQKCTIPLRDRELAPVVWYYSDGSNGEFFEGTELAAHEWDVAMRAAVMAGRYAECRRAVGVECDKLFPVYTGQFDDIQDAIWLSREVDDCRHGFAHAGQDCQALADSLGEARGMTPGVIALAKLPEHVVLCHSPVEAGDPAGCEGQRLPAGITAAMCAAKDRSAEVAEACRQAHNVRIGDLRYHQVNIITQPQTPSPWGIMVDSHDPLTGEKVAASINVWSHVNDLWSQGVVDLARYIKGELTTADVTEGTYVRDWAQASEAASSSGSSAGRMSKSEQNRRLASFLGADPAILDRIDSQSDALDPRVRERLAELGKAVRDIRADGKATSSTQPIYEARRSRARGSEMEAALTTKAMQQLSGLSGLEPSSASRELASPLGANALDAMSRLRKQRDLHLSERGACVMHEAPAPVGIAMLANVLEQKFGKFNPSDSKDVQLARAERMRRWVAQRAQYAVVGHEMGHSIALRHNFVSSSDAWGYRPQYWQLRTENGTIRSSCTDLVSDGASCVGPRWFDPVTQNEKDNLIWMFQQSSVMDYAGESSQDFIGLGTYDFAAARMFYGETVAVHADASYRATAARGAGMVDKMDGFGGLLGWRYVAGARQDPIHYSDLQKNYQLIKDCAVVDPELFKPARWDASRDGDYVPLVDSGIVKVGGKFTRCRQQPVDYVSWTSMRSSGSKRNAIDSSSRTRVPYGFATDRWADLGNVAVYRHDNGADPYELFDFLIGQQEMNHIFDNYRRGRQTFTVRGAAGRTLGRYNEKMRDGAKGIGLLVNIYRDFALEAGYDFDTLWPFIVKESFADNILASGIAFDHFTRQMQRPQSGEHYLGADGLVRSSEDTYANHATEPKVLIPNGATGMFGNISYGGKPLENALAEDKGEYDAEYTIYAGSYYDKAYTAMLMTESVDNFISASRSDFVDARFRSVSLADVFPEGYRRWLANNLTDDIVIKGPRIAATAQGGPAVDAKGFTAQPIGWTSWWPEAGPEACFPNATALTCGTAPANTLSVDPQVGWEQQKFLIAWTLLYLPENAKQYWLDQMGIWEIGRDSDPGFKGRIEFHDPSGKVYVAKTFGKESIFGRTVQKGVGARVLEYANELMKAAYETEDGPDVDGDGQADWFTAKLYGGQPRVKFDPTISVIDATGRVRPGGVPGCDPTDNAECTCSSNRACVALSRYTEIPTFIRQSMAAYGLADPSMKGIY